MYYRHPGSGRAWKGGSELRVVTRFHRIHGIRLIRGRIPNPQFRCGRPSILAHFLPLDPPKSPSGPGLAPRQPKGPPKVPTCAPRRPKGAQGHPKGSQRELKGTPKDTQREPRAPQREPKGAQGHPKDTQGKPQGQDPYLKLPINRKADVMLISPKAPDNLQDQFPYGFTKKGRRINSKHRVFKSILDPWLTPELKITTNRH